MASTAGYKAFAKNVGKWEGTIRVLDAELQETKRYNINQRFEEIGDKWVITNTYMFADGTSMSHSFDVIPTSEGSVHVTTEDVRFQATKMEAMEYGDDVVNFKIINTTTGKLQEIETITVIGENDRIRTAQLFNQNGEFKGLLAIAERRVG